MLQSSIYAISSNKAWLNAMMRQGLVFAEVVQNPIQHTVLWNVTKIKDGFSISTPTWQTEVDSITTRSSVQAAKAPTSQSPIAARPIGRLYLTPVDDDVILSNTPFESWIVHADGAVEYDGRFFSDSFSLQAERFQWTFGCKNRQTCCPYGYQDFTCSSFWSKYRTVIIGLLILMYVLAIALAILYSRKIFRVGQIRDGHAYIKKTT